MGTFLLRNYKLLTIFGLVIIMLIQCNAITGLIGEKQLLLQQVTIERNQYNGCQQALDNQTAAMETLKIDTDAIVAQYNSQILETNEELKIVRHKLDVENTCEARLKIILDQQQQLFTAIQAAFSLDNNPINAVAP